MTPRDLRNIHTTGNICRDTLPYANMALKLPQYFYLLMEKPPGCYFQVWSSYYQAVQCNQKTPISDYMWLVPMLILLWLFRPDLSPWGYWPQGDRSGLKSQRRISINTNHSYHQCSSPKASLNWSAIKPDSVLTKSIGKDGVRSWILHKAFLLSYHH